MIFIQFAKFALIGVLNTVLHYTVFLFLFRIITMNMLVATTIGYLCGMLNSFVLNRRWTFNLVGEGYWPELLKFLIVNGISLLINVVMLKILVNLNLIPEIAQFFAIGISVMVNFSGNKWWTFEKAVG